MNVKKFRTIYLAILIPVTVIVCVSSLMYRAVMIGKEINQSLKNANIEDFFEEIGNSFNGNFVVGVGNGSWGNVETIEYKDIEFTDIDLELAFANVEFKQGEEYRVVVEYPEDYMPEVKIENDTLIIKHETKNYKISFGGNSNVNCEVTIYIPEGAEFGQVEIETDLGNVEFKTALICDELNITADLGNVEMKNVEAQNLDIQADLGNVEIKDSSFGTVHIEADLGDVSLKDCKFDTAEITNDLGAIEVDGEFNNLTAECSLGALDVKCDNLGTAKMNLKTDLGAVSVNGSNKGSSYKQ